MQKSTLKYRITNWPSYNNSLKQRGSIDIWINEDVVDQWYANPTGKKGAQTIYSNYAIQICLVVGKVFKQRLRQTEGLLESIVRMMKLEIEVPNYSTLSRRGEKLTVNIEKNEKEIVAMIADSTGLKIFGEGEWKVRKHGYSKRRTWRKIHIGIDRDGEIRAVTVTLNDVHDSDETENLLRQEQSEIDDFYGDGGYDFRKTYNACIAREIKNIHIPPQQNAKIWKHGNCNSPPHPRDQNLRAIRKTTRKKWKQNSGYHARSLVENTMFRFKTTFAPTLNSRKFENQKTETLIMCRALNIMTHLGMPNTITINN